MEGRVLYEEETGWSWWIHPLLLLTLVAAVIPLWELAAGKVWGEEGAMPVWAAVLSMAIGFGLPLSIYSLMGKLKARVTPDGVEMRWGYLNVIKKEIPFSEVERAEATTYCPMLDFGGWGIRVGANKKKAWTVRGNKALLLHLKDGTQFFLGSEKPERILQWVNSAMKRSEG
jgi:hypothetical protein